MNTIIVYRSGTKWKKYATLFLIKESRKGTLCTKQKKTKLNGVYTNKKQRSGIRMTLFMKKNQTNLDKSEILFFLLHSVFFSSTDCKMWSEQHGDNALIRSFYVFASIWIWVVKIVFLPIFFIHRWIGGQSEIFVIFPSFIVSLEIAWKTIFYLFHERKNMNDDK